MNLRKSILLLAGILIIAYGNFLTNGFIGDTKSLFEHNSFYKNPSNLKRFLRRDFIMSPEQFEPTLNDQSSVSGCVSYRPVTALSFFIDYQLFRGRTFWHNLSNLFYHFIAVILVLFLARRLTRAADTALVAALIFAVHPIQAEAVDNIGYRSDLLVTIFGLLLLFCHERWRDMRGPAGKWLLAAAACLGAALFSKESALVLPFVVVIYDFFFLPLSSGVTNKSRKIFSYAAYAAVMASYLFVYFIVFPSAHYPRLISDGYNGSEKLLISMTVFSEYLRVLFFPLTVKILPPLHTPLVTPGNSFSLALTSGWVVSAVYLAVRIFPRNRLVTFCVLWFLVTFLPASNIIALPNPLAYRFLYLPMVGFAIAAAMGMKALMTGLSRRIPTVNWPVLLPVILMALLLSATIPTNAFYKNNLSACKEMIRRFPDSSRPYWILGLTYYEMAKFKQAAYYFREYAARDPRNAFVPPVSRNALFYHFLGRCYNEDPEAAIREFKKALQLKPDYLLVYLDLAKAYLIKKDFAAAKRYALDALKLNDQAVPAYVFAIHAATELKDFAAGRSLLAKVKALAPQERDVQFVEAFLNQRSQP